MKIAVMMIRGYQKWISPYKGFRCAHNVVYATGSCSCYGEAVFNEYPFFQAWGKLKERFKECKMAAEIYQNETPEQRAERERLQQQQRNQNSNGCGDIASTCAVLECLNLDLSILSGCGEGIGSAASGCGDGAAGCGEGCGDIGSGCGDVGSCT